jgi:hypothetical protein
MRVIETDSPLEGTNARAFVTKMSRLLRILIKGEFAAFWVWRRQQGMTHRVLPRSGSLQPAFCQFRDSGIYTIN